jgi:hypothetical protein
LYTISSELARINFMTYFKLPFAGARGYSAVKLSGQGSQGSYWSSSPYGSDRPYEARYLYFDLSDLLVDRSGFRAVAHSIRCFKDEYVAPAPASKTITYNPN